MQHKKCSRAGNQDRLFHPFTPTCPRREIYCWRLQQREYGQRNVFLSGIAIARIFLPWNGQQRGPICQCEGKRLEPKNIGHKSQPIKRNVARRNTVRRRTDGMRLVYSLRPLIHHLRQMVFGRREKGEGGVWVGGWGEGGGERELNFNESISLGVRGIQYSNTLLTLSLPYSPRRHSENDQQKCQISNH